jgi:hypothetical protein
MAPRIHPAACAECGVASANKASGATAAMIAIFFTINLRILSNETREIWLVLLNDGPAGEVQALSINPERSARLVKGYFQIGLPLPGRP